VHAGSAPVAYRIPRGDAHSALCFLSARRGTSRRWQAAQAARITGPEFVDLLDQIGLEVVEDTSDPPFFHVIRSPEGKVARSWDRAVTGTEIRRRKRIGA
jgi:hypothetical protein